MHTVTLTHHDGYAELSITSDHMKDIVRIYIREHTATVVKERGDEVLKAATFGSGCLATMLDYLVRQEPPTEDEQMKEMYRGVK